MKDRHIKIILYLIALGLFIWPIVNFFPLPKENLSGVVFLLAFLNVVPYFWGGALVFFGIGKYFSRQEKATQDIVTQYQVSSKGQNVKRTLMLIILAIVFILIVLKITSLNF